MNNKNILEALNDIDFDMVEDASHNSPQVKSSTKNNTPKRWHTVVATLSPVVIAVATLIIVLLVSNNDPTKKPDIPTDNSSSDTLLSVDYINNRELNNKNVLSDESAILWPWNCLAIYEQFGEIAYEGKTYSIRTSPTNDGIPLNVIGDKLGEATAYGYDIYEEKEHSTECEIYEIKGVDSARFVAVKYSEYDSYYPFIYRETGTYETLGDLVSTLSLTENINLSRFYSYKIIEHDIINELTSKQYALSEADSKELLYNIVTKYSTAPFSSEYPLSISTKAISFSINSNILGANNLSFSFNEEGYLFTNIENYGYYFYVGPNAVNEINTFALSHKMDIPEDTTKYLAGVVTEIGDDYIKIDDSILMANPDDGIVFTVSANNIKVKRYIDSDFLHVGAQVVVEYEGLSSDNPTHIQNATNLIEAIITDSDEVIIPE